MDTFPDTVPVANQYELALLLEECGETCQIAGKTLRFGLDSYDPADPSKKNLDLLHEEVGDVLAAADFACQRGLLDSSKLAARKTDKLTKLTATAPPVFHPNLPARRTLYLHKEPTKIETILAICIVPLLIVLPAVGFAFGTHVKNPTESADYRVQAAALAAQCYQTSIDTNACVGYAKMAGRPDLIPPPIKVPEPIKQAPATHKSKTHR